MRDAAILFVAAGFAAMAILALLRPAVVLAQFGVDAATADSRNEVRAVYGGFGIAVAVLLAVAALGDPSAKEGIAVAIAFALVGMAAGRLVSAAIEAPNGLYPVWTYFGIEVVSAGLLLLAVWA